MKKIVLVFIVLITGTICVFAEEELEEFKEYGNNCAVFNTVDIFTDEVSHIFSCRQSEFLDETIIEFFVNGSNGQFIVAISTGFQSRFDEEVEIAIRVDKNQLRTGVWSYYSEHDFAISLNDLTLFNDLLLEIARGNRLAIRVGDKSGTISLKGSANAITDFTKRIAHLNIFNGVE